MLESILRLLRKVNGSRKPLEINWLVPEPFPGAGGDTGLFRMIRHLAEFGHHCRVYVVAYRLMSDFSTAQVRQYVREHFGPTPAEYYKWDGSVQHADCTFATFWPTAENLTQLQNRGKPYYLVQDFEPSFYPGDEHHSQRAENTYRAGFHCITLGPWLAKLLREDYHAIADHFDFAVDRTIYHPRTLLRKVGKRVCFYARPSTPRRAYELGLAALRTLHKRLPEAEIIFFGSQELALEPGFTFVDRGLLGHADLAELFSSCDVGLVLSLTNPSFVPLEMMACGCVPVEIASERMEGVLQHDHDSWLVELKVDSIADGLIRLLDDDSLRNRLAENGIARTKRLDWRDSARQIEAVLLRNRL